MPPAVLLLIAMMPTQAAASASQTCAGTLGQEPPYTFEYGRPGQVPGTCTRGQSAYYHIFPIDVTTAGTFTVEVLQAEPKLDTILFVYRGFDPMYPCNPVFIAYDDDGVRSWGESRIDRVDLNSGTYQIVVAGWSTWIKGAFQIRVSTDNGAFSLFCEPTVTDDVYVVIPSLDATGDDSLTYVHGAFETPADLLSTDGLIRAAFVTLSSNTNEYMSGWGVARCGDNGQLCPGKVEPWCNLDSAEWADGVCAFFGTNSGSRYSGGDQRFWVAMAIGGAKICRTNDPSEPDCAWGKVPFGKPIFGRVWIDTSYNNHWLIYDMGTKSDLDNQIHWMYLGGHLVAFDERAESVGSGVIGYAEDAVFPFHGHMYNSYAKVAVPVEPPDKGYTYAVQPDYSIGSWWHGYCFDYIRYTGNVLDGLYYYVRRSGVLFFDECSGYDSTGNAFFRWNIRVNY